MAIALVLAGCSRASESDPVVRPDQDWTPAPVTREGLSVVAESSGTGMRSHLVLHTAHGAVTFWGGMNLGTSTPSHSPGEVAITAEQYTDWIAQMGEFGVRFLRVYTLHRPEFYTALRDYNLAHPTAPIYILHGVYLPDESYLDTKNLYDEPATEAFTQELSDLSDALSGSLTRPPTVGRASGTYSADVSPWLAGWIVGVEWDPDAVHKSDRTNSKAAAFHGEYFTTNPTSTAVTPTENWIAARMDDLAGFEAAHGRSSPMAFVNWPTADPLDHPTEPLRSEDLVSVDANHVLPTKRWPGGSFASFHAYPYYPDFLRSEPKYTSYIPPGGSEPDAYAGYLHDLKRHYARKNLPVMVTEFGVPASLGAAHFGTNGRDQGNHSEQDAMAIDAALLRTLKSVGMAGGLLFVWTDEWFKFTWNTVVRQSVVDSERRSLWHDPLTNEQWFGVVASDPVGTGWRTIHESRDDLRSVAIDTDPSFVHLKLTFSGDPGDPVRIGFDVVPSGQPLPGDPASPAVFDYAVVIDPAADEAIASVRSDIDPILLDGLAPTDVPLPPQDGWDVQRLTTNRSLTVNGVLQPAEFLEVGRLQRGSWDPESDEYDSLATWQIDGREINLRIPWSMLGFADPSSKTAVIPVDGDPVAVPVESVGLTVNNGAGAIDVGDINWEPWQLGQYNLRMKAGARVFAQALAETTG